jgi:RNA polymerase sigma factor (sigma-70 family)
MQYKKVYFLAFKMLGDEEEAKDVLQDTFITVFTKIKNLKNPDSFISWFTQIVLNKCKNRLAYARGKIKFAIERERKKSCIKLLSIGTVPLVTVLLRQFAMQTALTADIADQILMEVLKITGLAAATTNSISGIAYNPGVSEQYSPINNLTVMALCHFEWALRRLFIFFLTQTNLLAT